MLHQHFYPSLISTQCFYLCMFHCLIGFPSYQKNKNSTGYKRSKTAKQSKIIQKTLSQLSSKWEIQLIPPLSFLLTFWQSPSSAHIKLFCGFLEMKNRSQYCSIIFSGSLCPPPETKHVVWLHIKSPKISEKHEGGKLGLLGARGRHILSVVLLVALSNITSWLP